MITVATQGWNYDAWVGPFYPRKTRPDDYLGLYARMFDSVEVDSTFYAVPSDATLDGWMLRTPSNFTFALKLVRRITHELRLRDAVRDLDAFCEQARRLGSRLSSILIQLPPDFSPAQRHALEAFLPCLPLDLRFAIEFRDARWLDMRTVDLLARHRVALALVDGEWLPRDAVLEIGGSPTADFAYVRWMGPRSIVDHSRVQLDRDEEFDAWGTLLRQLASRVDAVFAYFSNFFQGHAPASASRMKALLGQTPADPETLVSQPSLF